MTTVSASLPRQFGTSLIEVLVTMVVDYLIVEYAE